MAGILEVRVGSGVALNGAGILRFRFSGRLVRRLRRLLSGTRSRRPEGLTLLAGQLRLRGSVLALQVEVRADRVIQNTHRPQPTGRSRRSPRYGAAGVGSARSVLFLPAALAL